jgi:lysophospholipase L1-like esterase
MLRIMIALLSFLSADERGKPANDTNCITYLALGDSYTIGEGVPIHESFPYLLVQKLRARGVPVCAPEIVAKTGWTTDELRAGMDKTLFLDRRYDLVTLLIGVNNQYRGRSAEAYAGEFEGLLKDAVAKAYGDRSRVFVLSIPDWGVTPFAEGRDRGRIAREIDAFNAVNKRIAQSYGVAYVDITPGTRLADKDLSVLASDKLHPSGKEYGRWADLVASGLSSFR